MDYYGRVEVPKKLIISQTCLEGSIITVRMGQESRKFFAVRDALFNIVLEISVRKANIF